MAGRHETAHATASGSFGTPVGTRLLTHVAEAVVAVAFWVSVSIPLAYLAVLATESADLRLAGLLFGVHALSLVVGHGHGR